MTPFKPGDVVAVEFPFTDFQTYKRRPGLVLTASEMDLLVARLTTHPPRPSTIRLTKTGFAVTAQNNLFESLMNLITYLSLTQIPSKLDYENARFSSI